MVPEITIDDTNPENSEQQSESQTNEEVSTPFHVYEKKLKEVKMLLILNKGIRSHEKISSSSEIHLFSVFNWTNVSF